MSYYRAPVGETSFLLKEVLNIQQYHNIPAFSDLSDELIEALLGGAAKFSSDVLAPLNAPGDTQGCIRHQDGSVTTPRGFKAAYRQLVEGGWSNIVVSPASDGVGLPYVIGAAVEEYLNSGNQSFCMYSNWGFYASMLMADESRPSLRRDYLAKLVSGEWTGTMAMTEPHAGTDLGKMHTRAVPQPDGTYLLTGTKIFISGGEHDLTPNIVHFVLARIEGAPQGSRGLSLFLVPKFLIDDNALAPDQNGVSCGSVEHKMGLRASATCVMHFDNAQGWLLGQPHQGLGQMFMLMNHTRRLTGVIAVAGAEAAYQRATAYVKERHQGKAPGSHAVSDPLIEQPDVRRVLMGIKSFADAGRLLVLWIALQLDLQERSDDPIVRKRAGDRISLLTPVAKAVLSDMAYEAAIAAQQMFGGHGYIVETGIEQYSRDLRMLSLAEGANGVQAMDLVGRKLLRDKGAIFDDYISEIRTDITTMAEHYVDLSAALTQAVEDVAAASQILLASDHEDSGYHAYDFMTALGLLALGHMWIRIIQATIKADDPGAAAENSVRLARARFFTANRLVETATCLQRIKSGADAIAHLPAEAF